MSRSSPVAAVVLVLLAACSERDERGSEAIADSTFVRQSAGEAVVRLDSATLVRIGLELEAVREVTRRDEAEVAAEIIEDPDAASTIRAGVSGALLTRDRPWPRYGGHLEAGQEVGAVGDARPIVVPRSGTVSRVLAQPGELVQAGQVLLEVVSYAEPLVRVAWTSELPPPPPTLALAVDGGARVRATFVGPAPEADPVTRAPAWLYRVPAGWSSMRPGIAVSAWVPTGGIARGVVIPAGAGVQWDALLWTFVERAPGEFARVRIPTDAPVPGGWMVRGGIAAGSRVVTRGAEQLLSEEFRARIVVGEEIGE